MTLYLCLLKTIKLVIIIPSQQWWTPSICTTILNNSACYFIGHISNHPSVVWNHWVHYKSHPNLFPYTFTYNLKYHCHLKEIIKINWEHTFSEIQINIHFSKSRNFENTNKADLFPFWINHVFLKLFCFNECIVITLCCTWFLLKYLPPPPKPLQSSYLYNQKDPRPCYFAPEWSLYVFFNCNNASTYTIF